MATTKMPVFLRLGDSPERALGSVELDSGAAELVPAAIAQMLRAAADEINPPAPEGDGGREQHSPRDRQVRRPGRDR